MKVRGFITHKAAEFYSDCADYFGICPKTNRIAISDGVSQSIMPAEWARILVDSFVKDEWSPQNDSTDKLKDRWLEQAQKFANKQREEGADPWMLENCLMNKDGAAATFCGIAFSDANNWRACVLGDSALVEIDKDSQILRICTSNDSAFDNRPDYFDSFKEDKGKIQYFKGIIEKGSKILLVSDPFSELFQKIKDTSDEKIIINKLLAIKDIADFNAVVDTFRKEYKMHNDDSTLVIIESDKSDSMTIEYQATLESLLQEEKKADDELWGKTIKEDNEAAYKNYIKVSILSIHKKDAEHHLKRLEEIKAEDDTWKMACESNRSDCYQRYVDLFPFGRHVAEANERIKKLCELSTHGKKPESKNDSAESSSSEDPFCKREDQVEKEQHLQKNTTLDKEMALPEKGETGNSATNHDETKTTYDTILPIKEVNVNPKEMEVSKLEEGVLAHKSGLDNPTDVDKDEFQKLQKKYRERFDKAYSRNKWNSDRDAQIDKCFADLFSELESIIYQNRNNG